MKTCYTSEIQKGRGKWRRSLHYPQTFLEKSFAMFASGREEDINIHNHITRHYRVVQYWIPA